MADTQCCPQLLTHREELVQLKARTGRRFKPRPPRLAVPGQPRQVWSQGTHIDPCITRLPGQLLDTLATQKTGSQWCRFSTLIVNFGRDKNFFFVGLPSIAASKEQQQLVPFCTMSVRINIAGKPTCMLLIWRLYSLDEYTECCVVSCKWESFNTCCLYNLCIDRKTLRCASKLSCSINYDNTASKLYTTQLRHSLDFVLFQYLSQSEPPQGWVVQPDWSCRLEFLLPSSGCSGARSAARTEYEGPCSNHHHSAPRPAGHSHSVAGYTLYLYQDSVRIVKTLVT